ncbi:uncharacterized protein LOC143523502 [Brachyhypopomus gauderio]|uniref:uncharacterized protein LOC143523502 n=1 Tax=Brachyhypopomus gauderio TaxID=698409 RepID=UPI004042742F
MKLTFFRYNGLGAHFLVGVRMVPYFRLVCGSVDVMAESKFTRCLLEFPKFTVNDVRRIVRASSTTTQSQLEKGFKFYVSSYLCNFEVSGKSKANEITVRAHCYRSMKKTDTPHQLRVGLVKMTRVLFSVTFKVLLNKFKNDIT